MSLYLGTLQPTRMWVGDKAVNEIYYGSTQIWDGSIWTNDIIEATGVTTVDEETGDDSGASPVTNYYRRCLFTVTYSAAELEAAFGRNSAIIKKVRLFVTDEPDNQPFPQYEIGMKMTTNATNVNNSQGSGGPFTLVKTQSDESFVEGTYKEFNLTSPFAWSSPSNFVISFAWAQAPNDYTNTGTMPIGGGVSFYSWTDSEGEYNFNTVATTQASYRPVIQLYG